MPIVCEREDDWIVSYSLEADEKRLGIIPIYWVSHKCLCDEFLVKCLKAWKLVKVDKDFSRRMDYYARSGIQAFIVRKLVQLGHCYWWFIREVLYRRLRLISPRVGYEFSWCKDFKPLRFILLRVT